MQYTHVFATHASLQENLVDAIIRRESIDPGRVLVLRVRKSFREGGKHPYTVLNGDRYANNSGWNVPAHRRGNRRKYEVFKQEVLNRLAPDFQMYSPMYTYWYLNVLAAQAAAYHVLEDGLGSFQSREELQRHFDKLKVRSWKKAIAVGKMRAAMLPGQGLSPSRGDALLNGVGRAYGTAAECFPWIDEERRVVLKNVFPPAYVGEYDGATVLGLSCLVEAELMSLTAYEKLLRRVIGKIAARGTRELYVKLHPQQAVRPENAARYRAVLTQTHPELVVRELPQGTGVEALAAGNRIVFITGLSTLAFHVAATGAEVLIYLDDIVELAPEVAKGITRKGEEILRRITKPL